MFFEALISNPGDDITPQLEAVTSLVEEGGNEFDQETKLVKMYTVSFISFKTLSFAACEKACIRYKVEVPPMVLKNNLTDLVEHL